jgi:aspartate kinase
MAMVLSRENIHEEERLGKLLVEKFGDEVRLTDGLGAVSVVGAGINTTYRNLRAGSAALEGSGVLGVSTSSFRITWLLPQDAVAEAVRQLHRVFLEAESTPVP